MATSTREMRFFIGVTSIVLFCAYYLFAAVAR